VILIASAVLVGRIITTQPPEIGVWESDGWGTIEFKEDSSFVIIDNMGTTSKGIYAESGGNLELKITSTNIMRRKMELVAVPNVAGAKMLIVENTLTLSSFSGDPAEIEIYTRVI
jgi:hypothetical protein